MWDGLWIRVVDVPRALAERAYAGTGRVTIEVVSDPRFPDNVGIWTIEEGSVRRARRRPDLRMPVAALGSAYLGGIPFAQLCAAGHAEEVSRGGAGRADALFAGPAPWCPEIF